MAMAVSRGRAAALGNDWSDFLSLCKASCFMPDISTTSSTALDGVDGATLPAATDTTAFDTAIQSVQEQPENEAGASPDSDGQATGDAAPASDGQATVVLWDDIVADLVAGATGHNNVTNSDPAPATVTDTAESNKAEVYRKLRSALAENMRENATSPGQLDGISDDQVLAELTQVPDPFSTDDDKIHEAMLDVMRDLYAALDLYGGKEGEEGVSPAQTKLVYGQLLLALTQDIDWETVLAAPAAEGGVTFDGVVLHGATTMTLAAAAAAIKDKIRTALVANELGNWATNMTDRIAPVLIGDPTLFLEPPSETILYGSLQWAQLRLGFEFAAEQGLDPANLTADQILALGRATMTKPAPTTGEAGADATVDQEDADATATRTTRALLLIGQAFGDLDAATIASGTEEQIEEAFDKAARHAFPEDYALIDALDAISAEMPERKKLAAEYLTSAHKEPHEVYHYMTFAAGHAIYNTTTLADYYFENDTVHEIDGLPKLSESFEAKFGEYKSNYANGMATIIENRLADYAAEHDFDLNGGTTWVSVRRPALNASKQTPRLEGGVNLQKMDPIYSNTHLIIEMVEKERDTPRRLLLNLEKLDEGLQEIPLDAASTWVMEHRKEYFAQAQLDLFDQKLADGAVPNDDPSKLEPEIASKLHSQLSAAIVDFYDKEIEGYHKSARGQTFGESVGEFFLNLIPFRAMIVAIQDGKPGEAILNGLLDIVSFIPFVGEAAKAVQIGSKALSAGIAAALRATAQKGLAAALAGGLRATASLGREFGWQLLKTAATGLENALPIPTPGLSSKIGAAGAKDMVRVIDNVKAADTALGEALESLGRRNSLIDIADGGSWQLASDLKVSKNAKGADVIELDAIKLSLSEKKSIDLDDITLTVGEDLNGEPLFLKEHGVGAEAFYTLIDPSTGTSYGKRFTFDDAGWLFAGSAKIGRLGVTAGSTGNETVNGSTGDETVTGANGNINGDTVDGSEGGGNDTAIGSTGDQAVTGTDGDINGGTTNDKTALYEALTNAFMNYERTELDLDANASREQVVFAYFNDVEGSGPGPRLEDDAALMAVLMKSSGLYANDFPAADLTIGQKRELAALLMLGLTSDIDWKKELGQDPLNPDELVWYDGVTLRNAENLSVKAASEAIGARIKQALDQTPAYQGDIYIRQQLLRVLIEDPNLSLAPPPDDINYGSREWAKLWMGAQMASHTPDLADLSAAELQELGQAGMLQEARDALPAAEASDAKAVETDPESGRVLFLMANAAGKLEATDDSDALAVKLANFAEEEFKDELALTVMPTREQIAKDELKKRGIDPDWILLDYDEVSNPAGYLLFGPSDTIGQYYFKHGNIEHVIELVSKQSPDDTFDHHLPGLFSNDEKHEAVSVPADELSKMASDLPDAETLVSQFNERFDNYCKGISEYQSQSICDLITDKLFSDGFDLSQTTLSLSRPHVKSTFALLVSMDELTGDSYFLQAKAGAATKTYFVARSLEGAGSAADVIYELPGVTDDDGLIEWSQANAVTALGNKYGAFYKKVIDSSYGQKFSVEKCNLGNAYESRDISDVRAIISSDINNDIAAKREEAAGSTNADAAKEFLLSLVPLRQTFKAIKNGQWGDALVSGYFDLLTFLPVGGPLLKTLSTGKSLGAASFKALARSIASSGLKSALPEGVTSAWTAVTPWRNEFFKQLGNTALAVGDALSPVPGLGSTQLFDVGKTTIAKFTDIAAVLKFKNVALAGKIEAAAKKLPALVKVDDAAWTVKVETETGSVGEISEAPLYVTATDAPGNKLKLMRHSDSAYVQYDSVTLAPVGPVLLADATGHLYKSIDVAALPRFAIEDGVRQEFVGKAASSNGTILLGGDRYARLFDDVLVRLVKESETQKGNEIWRVVDPTNPANQSGAPRLIYDTEKKLWLHIEAGGLAGGDGTNLQAQANGLAATLELWTTSKFAGLTNKDVADMVEQMATNVYGQRYTEYIQTNRDLIDKLVYWAKTPQDAAIAVLGEARFLHAMQAGEDAGAEHLILALDTLRSRALASTDGQAFVEADARLTALDNYFGPIIDDLSTEEALQLRIQITEESERSAALLGHVLQSGNLAQKEKALQLSEMEAALKQALTARLDREKGAGYVQMLEDALQPRPANAEPSADEMKFLRDLGLDPQPIDQALLDDLAAEFTRSDKSFDNAPPKDALQDMTDVHLNAAQAETRTFLLTGDNLKSAEFSKAKLKGIETTEDGLVFHFESRDLTFSNRGASNREFRSTNLKKAAERLDFQSIEDLIRRGETALLEGTKWSIAVSLESKFRALGPANEEAIKLLYRALLMDDSFTVNGRPFSEIAKKYGVSVEDLLAVRRKVDGIDDPPLTPNGNGPSGGKPTETSSTDDSGVGSDGDGGNGGSPSSTGLSAQQIAAYRLDARPEGLEPDPSRPQIYLGTAGRFVELDGNWFAAKWDDASGTWTIVAQDNPAKPAIPIRQESNSWLLHGETGLKGGGGSALANGIDDQTAQFLDRPIPDDIPRQNGRFLDATWNAQQTGNLVSETETVFVTRQLLEQATDTSVHADVDDTFDDYFDFKVDLNNSAYRKELEQTGQLGAKAIYMQDNVRNFYLDLYANSPTFRRLYNRARLDDGLRGSYTYGGATGKWTIQIEDPEAEAELATFVDQNFRVEQMNKLVHVPNLASKPQSGHQYITDGGELAPFSAERTLVHEMMHILTNVYDPDITHYYKNGELDEAAVQTSGLGERGAIEYMTQRIMEEAGIKTRPRLSYMSYTEDDIDVLTLAFSYDYGSLDRYVKLQNDYLEALFPREGGSLSPSNSSTSGASSSAEPVSDSSDHGLPSTSADSQKRPGDEAGWEDGPSEPKRPKEDSEPSSDHTDELSSSDSTGISTGSAGSNESEPSRPASADASQSQQSPEVLDLKAA
jgi:hypothetical protein